MQNQAYAFIVFILNGFLIGLLFDIFRIFRKSFKTPDFITCLEDFIFWIITGLLLLYSIFKFNNGENNKGLTLNDVFNDFFNESMLSDLSANGGFKTDIKETPEEYVLHAELPGVKKEDINIDYDNNYLTISATKNTDSKEKKENYLRRERSYGSVSRGFYLNNVNKDLIKAKFDNGVLNVHLPKKEKFEKDTNKIVVE